VVVSQCVEESKYRILGAQLLFVCACGFIYS